MPQSRSRHCTLLAAEALRLERRGDRVDRRLEVQAVELAGIHAATPCSAYAVLPRRIELAYAPAVDVDHLHDRQAVLLRELEVALVVARHAHDGAFAVGHQHVVADPDWQPLRR